MNEGAILKAMTAAFRGQKYDCTVKEAVEVVMYGFPGLWHLIPEAMKQAGYSAHEIAYAFKIMRWDKAKAAEFLLNLLTPEKDL